jgi:hypothetical protein
MITKKIKTRLQLSAGQVKSHRDLWTPSFTIGSGQAEEIGAIAM